MPLTRLGHDVERNAERAVQGRQHARFARFRLLRKCAETVKAAKPVALQSTEDGAKGAASVLGPTVSALGLKQKRHRREWRDARHQIGLVAPDVHATASQLDTLDERAQDLGALDE